MGEIADALRQARDAGEAAPPRRPLPDSRRSEIQRELSTGEAARAVGLAATRDQDEARPEPQLLKREGDDPWRPARIALADPRNHFTDQYRRLAFRVRDLADARGARSIVVMSAQPAEGKTTTSCNLAVQLARLDQSSRVVLVDLDLRRPTVARALGVECDPPVDAVLRGEVEASAAVIETDVPGLAILGAAEATEDDPEWLLAHPNLNKMIRQLADTYDRVVIDTPPVLAASDAQVILRNADAGILVARAGASTVASVRRALDQLPASRLLGSFLNSSKRARNLARYDEYAYRTAYGSADPKRRSDHGAQHDAQTEAPSHGE